MKINLHIHTDSSLDGVYDVNDIIQRFENENYDIISITDHNTCESYEKILNNKKIKIISGMEADAIVNNNTYDFLCYGFNIKEVAKYAFEKYDTIENRQQKIFDALLEKCQEHNIKLKRVCSYNSSLEYAQRMLDKKFLRQYKIKTGEDLYRISVTDKTFPLYIDMHMVWPNIEELVNVIHQNNGKIFLAHPYRYYKPVTEVLNDVKDYIDGIEISNNPMKKKEVKFLYNYAKENNLLVSCGSNYHGNDDDIIDCNHLTEEMINDVLSWIE